MQNTRQACKITDRILEECIKNIKTFKTEKQVYNFLIKRTKQYKCKLAFSPIVASSKHSSIMHYKATNSKIKKGFLVIDFGVKYNGFCSDETRTIYIGKPAKKEIKDYNKLLKIQKKIISMIKPGKYYCDLDIKARLLLGKDKIYFNHSLGHGVGKKVHSDPKINSASKDKIKINDMITIEPGIYKKDYGIRIEDTILVKNKPIILTKTDKNLVCIN